MAEQNYGDMRPLGRKNGAAFVRNLVFTKSIRRPSVGVRGSIVYCRPKFARLTFTTRCNAENEGENAPSADQERNKEVEVQPDFYSNAYITSTLGEYGLAALAIVLAPIVGVSDQFSSTSLTGASLAYGALLSLPLLAIAVALIKVPSKQLREVTKFSQSLIVSVLGKRSPFDVFVLCLGAGLGEELLFRNTIMVALERSTDSFPLALSLSSVAFGLVHFASVTYAILSGMAGLYFGLEYRLFQNNVVEPVVTHTLYDFFLALLILRTSLLRVDEHEDEAQAS